MTNHSHDVTLIHRRDSLRAEKILQDRLFAHPNIKVMWNREVAEFVGGGTPEGLVAVDLRDTRTGEIERLDTEGAFVAIGHSPATELFRGQLELDEDGYIRVEAGTHADQRARRLRLRRRDGQDLPPGGDRRRHRLHGRARRREIPRRGRFRGGAGGRRFRTPDARRAAGQTPSAPSSTARRGSSVAASPRRRAGRRCANRSSIVCVARIRPSIGPAPDLGSAAIAVASPTHEDRLGGQAMAEQRLRHVAATSASSLRREKMLANASPQLPVIHCAGEQFLPAFDG